jgi:pyruvate dehydrogenase E2 component (dihydrolipoamide acetyltransferase)
MPALGMAQDTGRLIRWLVEPGAAVNKGDPLMEVETDKAVVEIEAPASGILAQVTAAAGDEVPVTHVIAVIIAPGELSVTPGAAFAPAAESTAPQAPSPLPSAGAPAASPLAVRIATEHGVDLRLIVPQGDRVEKADVLAYVEARDRATRDRATTEAGPRRVLASPKARRLAAEQGLALATLRGTGPDGAIQASDVQAAMTRPAAAAPVAGAMPPPGPPSLNMQPPPASAETMSTIWRVMAERITQCWTSVPHFYLVREVNAERLIAWRARLLKRSSEEAALAEKITFTDLLTMIVAAALVRHPRVNASWRDGAIVSGSGIHVGIAVAVEDGLVVPVIHDANRLGVSEIARRRQELMGRAQAGSLRPEDLSGGTFTISNLGMYGVDAFNAIVNPPQAAILAVGRISDRVVAVNGQPAVRPTLILSLSFDHRVVDGARGAAFLDTLADLIEEPLALFQ